MTIEDAGDHLKEAFFTKSPSNDLSPNLSYLSPKCDGQFHEFIENEPDCSKSPFPGSSPEPIDVLDCSSGCSRGGFLTAKHDPCGKCRTIRLGCNSRFSAVCPICSKKWVRKNKKKCAYLLSCMQNPKLMTLTLWYDKKKGHCPNLLDIHRMMNSLLHRLRYHGYVVRSWYAVVEFPNHLHVVIDCDYVPQDKLSQYWKDSSGGSIIVDIRAINLMRAGSRPTVNYVTKYLAKACGFAPMDVQKCVDDSNPRPIQNTWTIDELKGFHIVQSRGLNVPKKGPMHCDCGFLGHWSKTSFEFSVGSSDNSVTDWVHTDKGPPIPDRLWGVQLP